ncbi:MAG: TIGR02217 family protein [Hyphomicrobiaceae bacterium]
MAFHDVRFPTGISLRASGGPERRTDVVTLASGREHRNARWADSRRRYDAAYGIRTRADLQTVIAFFEARRGRLHAFRWRDPIDWTSGPPGREPTAFDCEIAIGDGATDTYQLAKSYGDAAGTWLRDVTKPVAGSVRIGIEGVEITDPDAFEVDPLTGLVVFATGHVPEVGQRITAGFQFDVPVRFDTDAIEVSLQGPEHGAVPNIPIIEVRA